MHPCHVWRLEHAQERWEAFQTPGVEQNSFIKEICNIIRWIAGEILNTLVMSTYASLWVYIYIFLAQCRLYVALCSFHMWFPIHYFYPLPFAVGVLAWHWPGSSHYFRFGWHPNWFRRWAKSVDSQPRASQQQGRVVRWRTGITFNICMCVYNMDRQDPWNQCSSDAWMW